MDELGGLTVQYYSRRNISEFLSDNPLRVTEKKVWELVIGKTLAEHLWHRCRTQRVRYS